MFLTIRYKTGYIHFSQIGAQEIIRVQVDAFAYSIQVRSEHAAKVLISKHSKKVS